ncbi:hypothetical protein IHN63_01635 [Deinococcus sp. 6YEL10]|uniref:beta family protein n=1 Tax=Deinococcus sp. 6YEL10 TaxID=2745870 RepID=UPI001E485565|nr:beta family protein [Deinococcus sp. 6YEL10]MCD0160000.1 hypothetical protein [Deinococcus sp. 6YEL10]
MFSHYMPVLKPKKAEMEGLFETAIHDVDLYPLIELAGGQPRLAERPSRAGGAAKPGRPAQLMSDYLEKAYRSVERAVGGTPVLMDPHLFLHRHPQGLTTLIEHWEQWRTDVAPLRVIPVLRLELPTSVLEPLVDFARTLGAGAGLRLLPKDLAREDLEQAVRRMLESTSFQPGDMDLIIDAQTLVNVDRTALKRQCIQALELLSPLAFRTFTLTASSYAENPPSEIGWVDRLEPPFWEEVRQRVSVDVQFGDYGVDAPTQPVDPEYVQLTTPMPVAAVRYTLKHQWLFLKDAAVTQLDEKGEPKTIRGDFRNVCRRLLGSGYFYGAAYSAGDQYFDDMAHGRFENAGESTRWRQAMYSHHFTVVLNDLTDDEPEATPVEPALPF